MYLEFFKLKDLPFRLTPDSDFLYMSGAHSRAKAYMDYTVWNREGFVVITGEIGSGKTTLIQKLISELDETCWWRSSSRHSLMRWNSFRPCSSNSA